MQRVVECEDTRSLNSFFMGDRFYREGSCDEWLLTDGQTGDRDTYLCVRLRNGETRELGKAELVYRGLRG